MIAFTVSLLILVGALAVSALAWLLLGKPEPMCVVCVQPESLCDCDVARPEQGSG